MLFPYENGSASIKTFLNIFFYLKKKKIVAQKSCHHIFIDLDFYNITNYAHFVMIC